MKIYDTTGNINITKKQSQQEIESESNTKGVDGPDSSKSPNISRNDSVKRFVTEKVKLSIDSEPEVRSDRLVELMEQIKRGEYKVDSQKIAGKILVESLSEGLA